MITGYIYKITSPTGRIYVGQTTRLSQRVNCYKRGSCSKQRLLQNSINKFGWDNHKFEIIETVQSEALINILLNSLELYWIGFYRSNFCRHPNIRGLNLSDGGKGIRGHIASSEQKKKMSVLKTIFANSDKGKEISRRNATGNSNKRGKKIGLQGRINIGISSTGRVSTRRKPIAATFANGHVFKEFESVQQASIFMGGDKSRTSNISKSIIGSKIAYGYYWKEIE